jgi:predicted RNA-binding Zn-ribbon protein involved in translation (DUF1610 family)
MNTCEDSVFVCPACARSITVTESMREALVKNGCVICGTNVPRNAFDSRYDDS